MIGEVTAELKDVEIEDVELNLAGLNLAGLNLAGLKDVEMLAVMREGFVHVDLSTRRMPKLDWAVSTTRLRSVMTRTTTANLRSPKSGANG